MRIPKYQGLYHKLIYRRWKFLESIIKYSRKEWTSSKVDDIPQLTKNTLLPWRLKLSQSVHPEQWYASMLVFVQSYIKHKQKFICGQQRQHIEQISRYRIIGSCVFDQNLKSACRMQESWRKQKNRLSGWRWHSNVVRAKNKTGQKVKLPWLTWTCQKCHYPK